MESAPVSTLFPQTSWQQVVRSSPGLECMVKQFTNCPKDINPTSCSSTPRLHLVYGATWGEGKYNPSLKTIFFGQKMFFFFRKQISTEDPRHPKGLEYVTSIILGMSTDAARNRLLKKREPVFMA